MQQPTRARVRVCVYVDMYMISKYVLGLRDASVPLLVDPKEMDESRCIALSYSPARTRSHIVPRMSAFQLPYLSLCLSWCLFFFSPYLKQAFHQFNHTHIHSQMSLILYSSYTSAAFFANAQTSPNLLGTLWAIFLPIRNATILLLHYLWLIGLWFCISPWRKCFYGFPPLLRFKHRKRAEKKKPDLNLNLYHLN